MSVNRNSIRTRNFATVVYKDSAPENWQDILSGFFVPTLISPYHDNDINADGTPKKPHWHVLIMFEGVKTVEQATNIFNQINGVGCEIVNSLRGYARYLCHLDNPDKAQYDIKDVVAFCGADYSNVINLVSDKYKAIREMMSFCEKHNVYSFYLLSQYAFENNESWVRVLCDSGAVYMREYLKSKDWSFKNNYHNIINKDTGEILI